MGDHASVIGDVLAACDGEIQLERELFATVDPDAIAEAVDAFCQTHLGAAVRRYEFFATSVGSVHGVLLVDGRRVVIKVNGADADDDHLLAVQGVQNRLSELGFPSPRPLLGPTSLAHGLAVVETLLDAGSSANAHEPAVRAAMASTLADLIEICRPLAGLEGLQAIRDSATRLWR